MYPLRGLHQPLSGICRGRRPRLWLGLSGADGRGIDAEPDRHRRSRTPAECLDLLRAVRKRMPGQDPVAEDDAALAGARTRQEAEPAGLPQRPCGMGMGSASARALSPTRGGSQPGAGLGRCAARSVPRVAAGGRLDQRARHAGPRGPELSEPLGATEKSEAVG